VPTRAIFSLEPARTELAPEVLLMDPNGAAVGGTSDEVDDKEVLVLVVVVVEGEAEISGSGVSVGE